MGSTNHVIDGSSDLLTARDKIGGSGRRNVTYRPMENMALAIQKRLNQLLCYHLGQ